MKDKLPILGMYKCIKGYHENCLYELEIIKDGKYFLSDYPRHKYYWDQSENIDITIENFWEYFEEIPDAAEAMEKLKEELDKVDINYNKDWLTDNSLTPNQKAYISLRIASENLLNALYKKFNHK